MCGIAGIIGRVDKLNLAALERMSEAMVHRGPDASGTWVSSKDSRGWVRCSPTAVSQFSTSRLLAPSPWWTRRPGT